MAQVSKNGNKNRTELNFWVMPNVGFATRSVLQPFIDEFERQNPDIHVNLTIHPWSLTWTRLMDVVKGRYVGTSPDVMQVGTTWIATLVHLGALDKVPLSAVLAEADKMSAYVWDPGAPSETDDELHCVPWFIDVRVLYYRKDIFNMLGLNADALQDWKSFYIACTEIQKFLKRPGPVMSKLIGPIAIPGQKLGVLVHDLAPWVWGAGGDFFDPVSAQSKLKEPATIKGIEFYFDLIKQGFMPIPETAMPQGNFFTGHYVMQFTGSWPGDTYLNMKSPLCVPEVAEGFGVSLLPAGPQGRYTFLGGSNLAVTSQSEKKDAAWEFVRFMSNPGRQLDHARSIGSLTARLSSFEQLFEHYPDVKKVFWDSLGHARRLPRLVLLGSVEQIISKLCDRLLTLIKTGQYNGKLLQDEINIANQRMDSVLSLHRYGATSGPGTTVAFPSVGGGL